METTLLNMLESYNTFCAGLSVDRQQRQLKALQDVKIKSINKRNPPAEAILASASGYKQTILSAGTYHCSCPAYKFNKRACKHLIMIAAHAYKYIQTLEK